MGLRLTLVTAVVAVLTVIVLNREPEELPPAAESSIPAPGVVTPANEPAIDSIRLLRHLTVLAHDSMEGRGAATEGGARARRYLLRALAESGVEPMGERVEVPFALPGGRTAVNLLGRVPGVGVSAWQGGAGAPRDGVIVLSAHYDHEGVRDGQIYNGADDNASGVATVLEIARVLREQPLRHSIIVALFDAEESGLLGAEAFLSDPPVPLSEIELNVNLDMVSRTSGVLWAAGAAHRSALRPPLEAAAAGAPTQLRLGHDRPGAPEGADWTSQSDHGPFHQRDIPFVYFGVEDHPDYHRPTDDIERVDPGDFVAAARTILIALRALDAALPLP